MTLGQHPKKRRHLSHKGTPSGRSLRRRKQLIERASHPVLFGEPLVLPDWMRDLDPGIKKLMSSLGVLPAPLAAMVDRQVPADSIEATFGPGEWWCHPDDCPHEHWWRIELAHWQHQREGVRLDCARPVCVECRRCGTIKFLRCKSSSLRDCPSCSRRKLEERKHQMADAVHLWLHHRVYVYWLALTFPGFGGCDDRMCGCNGLVSQYLADNEGATLDDWVAHFNGRATIQFRDWKQAFEREFGIRFEHVKLLEPQMGERKKSGRPTKAFHFHAIIISDGPVEFSKAHFVRLANHHGFGHSFHWEEVGGTLDHIVRRIGYVTKYAKHSVDGIRDAPYDHPVTGRRQRSRCRSITMSRGFSETLRARRERNHQFEVLREQMRAMRDAREARVAADDPWAAPADHGGADALESLVAQLHKLIDPALPSHRLLLPM